MLLDVFIHFDRPLTSAVTDVGLKLCVPVLANTPLMSIPWHVTSC
jgi:hypothetical protein